MFETIYEILGGVLQSVLKVFLAVWWLVLPVFLFSLLWRFWLIYIRTSYVNGMKWALFEIKIPKEILKTPKAMETVFASLYSVYSFGPNRYAKYLDGKVETWLSFEMVGYAGGIYFFVYAPLDKKNLIESAIYSQYPNAEIKEIEDYVNLVPSYLPNEVYDIFGGEMVLAKENYYPIRTYYYFEDPSEEKRLDPLSALSEAMTKLKNDEMIWLQLLFSPTGEPTGNKWKEEGKKKIDEIIGRKKDEKKAGWLDELHLWFKNLFWAPVEHPTWGAEKKPEAAALKFLSPDETELIKEISNKISRQGFEAFIRFVYIDKRDSFSPANIAAIFGSFQQFNTQHLNAFKARNLTSFDSLLARISSRYKNLKTLYKKRRMFDYYKQRRFGKYNRIKEEEFPVFNTEELATVFHFPTIMVEAPKVRRVEAKKGGPPPGLPVE